MKTRLTALLLALLLPCAALAEEAIAALGEAIALPVETGETVEALFALPDAAGVILRTDRDNADRQGDSDLRLLLMSPAGEMLLNQTLNHPHYGEEAWLSAAVFAEAEGAALEIVDPELKKGARWQLTRTDTGYSLGERTPLTGAAAAERTVINALPFRLTLTSGGDASLTNLTNGASVSLSLKDAVAAGAVHADSGLFLLATQGDGGDIDLRWFDGEMNRLRRLRLGGADSLIAVTAAGEAACVVTAHRRDFTVVAVDPAAQRLLWSRQVTQAEGEADFGVADTARGPALLFSAGTALRLALATAEGLTEARLTLAAPMQGFVQPGDGRMMLLLRDPETGTACWQELILR